MPLARFFRDRAAGEPAKRERRKLARPGELLEAALDLFVEKGFAATRMEQVALRAGVSKGTVFLYFPSKEELFKAVVRENISGRFQEWEAEFQRFEGSSADMLRRCMNAWWQRVGATRASGISKLMISEGSNFPDIADFYQREVVQPGHALIRRVLQRGMASGEFRPINLDNTACGVVALMMFLTLSRHATACVSQEVPIEPEAYIASQTDMLLYGLCAPAPTHAPSSSSSASSPSSSSPASSSKVKP